MKLLFILILALVLLSHGQKRRKSRRSKSRARPQTTPQSNIQDEPEKCGPLRARQAITVTDKEGEERTLVCLKHKTDYIWTELDKYFSSLGERVNPAISCSDIAQKNKEAKNGYYWINSENLPDKTKVWCDFTTNTGGFMLIGYADSPISWKLSSNNDPVSPFEKPHWSSSFGDIKITEFRVQISTSMDMNDTKADWLYHFSTPRPLSELFINGRGGCSVYYPGIGDIEYVKDLMTDTIVTEEFNCSQFGPTYPSKLGWQKMNECFRKPCSRGFAYLSGDATRYDNYGSFSYSTSSPRSGLINKATAFVGCEHGQCCACFGPEGETGEFCSTACQGVNGGTVTRDAHTWFWVRTSPPRKPVWNRCVEFEIQSPDGITETHFINGKTGIVTKGTCAQKGVPSIIDGVVKVTNKKDLKDLPSIQGLLSYSKDVDKLYLSNGSKWDAISTETQNKKILNRIVVDEGEITRLFRELKHTNEEFERKVKDLENRLKASQTENLPKSCQEVLSRNPNSTSGVYWIKPLPNHDAFGVYCDMITQQGGWTLVYSYSFTNYKKFYSKSNAVTPRPNWPVREASVAVSTTPPLDEWSAGAVDFNLWREIGTEFMIKSNINDWIVCKPNGGSLVTGRTGAIDCKNIKNVAPKCIGIAPKKIAWHKYGPFLSASSVFYDFEHNMEHDWPAHDPCGRRKPDHKKGVVNPGGAILIR
ncbi:uncharacterized protein LOC114517056 [Dendronephthya gigantea]|uniref:uncharacterized protein LOC114517056 n=1 Tax=Dendronephthya gigantea TaxID=151771 RepID=UPI0010697155|nr:uncharacterized protein LOC114517056 [Dendronephthya gigantea]